MQNIKAAASVPVTTPSHARQAEPATSQPIPQRHTALMEIAPEGMGRDRRCCRSNSTWKASFKNIPPTYRKVVPASRNGSFWRLPPPLTHQPARQFDQSVGRFETRPRSSNVRRRDMQRLLPGNRAAFNFSAPARVPRVAPKSTDIRVEV